MMYLKPRFGSIPVLFCLISFTPACSTLYRNSMAKPDDGSEKFGNYAPKFAPAHRAPATFQRPFEKDKPIRLRQNSASRNVFNNSLKPRSIIMGMGMIGVRNIWGLPDQVQVAGTNTRTGNRHERWVYNPTLYEPVTRVVYFEGDRVTGWERQ